MPQPTLEEFFWARVLKGETPDDCWDWSGGRVRQYGRIKRLDGTDVYAHRLSYKLCHGSIPEGAFILHHCDNPPCTNPRHLYAGTQQDNVHDAIRKGRFKIPQNLRQDFCKRGHPMKEPNIIWSKAGYRRCRECAYIAHRNYKAKKREERLLAQSGL